MKIYNTLQIGDFHTHYCEDFLIIEDISETEKIIAVLDGCSMGKESVFASILYGKILRNIARKEFYKDFVIKEKEPITLQDRLKSILEQLISEVKKVQQQLNLTTHELLSTLILGVLDTKKNSVEVIVVGDGLVVCNGEFYDFEQEDKPDYLGYHLHENFEEWYNFQKQRVTLNQCKDISICTDGIFAFKNLKKPSDQKSEKEIMEYLLIDNNGEEFDNFLDRKMKALKEKWNHIPTDDIAIIRIKV